MHTLCQNTTNTNSMYTWIWCMNTTQHKTWKSFAVHTLIRRLVAKQLIVINNFKLNFDYWIRILYGIHSNGKLPRQMTVKVKTLWEGHKIRKNLPLVLTKQLFLLSSVKQVGDFFKIFAAILEMLNFKLNIIFMILLFQF